MVWIFSLLFLASLSLAPLMNVGRKMEISRPDNNPAVIGQRLLEKKFGVAGTPGVILIEGTAQEVMEKGEALARSLEELKSRGIIKSVFSPTYLLPSPSKQREGMRMIAGMDLERSADILERELHAAGFNVDYFRPAIGNLRRLGTPPLTPLKMEEVLSELPEGLLGNSIRKTDKSRYTLALAYYSSSSGSMEELPAEYMAALSHQHGPFVEFSYPRLNRELQDQILKDNHRALFLTLAGIVLIVYLCFRNLRTVFLILVPILVAVCMTYALLIALGYSFSFMAFAAIPLIVGIGIDNGIHLTRRFLESDRQEMIRVLADSGAALLQSNITTILGFGALVFSSFEPLSELGMVTALGVAFTLMGSLLLTPSLTVILKIRRDGPPAPLGTLKAIEGDD